MITNSKLATHLNIRVRPVTSDSLIPGTNLMGNWDDTSDESFSHLGVRLSDQLSVDARVWSDFRT